MAIGCVEGGSSFGGVAFPFVKDKIDGKDLRLIAVEPEACPTLTQGLYAYDFGDTAELTLLVKMFTLGHTFVPPRIHAGGLRYHGMAPLISQLHHDGIIEAQAVHQNTVFASAVQFAQTEAIIPAPEPSQAIHVSIQEALKCKESGEAKDILFLLCGHGHFDMSAYDEYFAGNLVDQSFTGADIEKMLASIPAL
jgi:tryptophan synthase beta chain